MRVAYQGMPGAYSEAAVVQRWGAEAEPVPCPHLEDVFDAVESDEADAGLVPVENTIEGSISRTYDLLNERSLTIKGETIFRVVHCLIANPGAKLENIKRVYSHPQALGQTRDYLAAHGYEPVSYFDTAGAVKMLRDDGLREAGAVASRRAAEIYGLTVLAEGIETNRENYTRFLYLGRDPEPPTGRDKTSLAFTIEPKPGALQAALGAIPGGNIKVESRPHIGRPWGYVFFVDFEGHKDDPSAARALSELSRVCESLKILGSYPRA